MGKVNVCLKRSFIVVISLIALIDLLLLGVTLFCHGRLEQNEETEEIISGIRYTYALTIFSLVLTLLGGFGACKEKKWALIVFVVGMILNSLFLFGFEMLVLAVRSEILQEVQAEYLHMLPLTNASQVMIDNLDGEQREFQCCGVQDGYVEWGFNIPESCLCVENPIHSCVAAPKNSSLSEGRVDVEPIMIYSEPCLPHVTEFFMNGLKVVVGTMMGVTLLLVLSVMLGIVMLCRLDQTRDTPPVVYCPEAKAGNYTTLTETTEDR